jgi:dipeptidyl aminopeptidase/acylaminoacyl peptidase
MLTGRPLFDADSVPAILAEVLRAPIDLAELPPSTPAPLRELVRRCVERNRDRRLHDIADARLVLEDLESGEWEDAPAAPATTPTTAGRRPALLALAAAAAAGLVVGAAATRLLLASGEAAPPETPETPEPMVRFEIAIPDAAQAKPALSPEARRVAYASGGLLWIRDLDRLEPTAVAGSEGASAPFWSPDGESLGYFAERAVWHIPVAGGRPTLLTQVPPGTSNTGLWLPDDRILFTTGASGVLEVSARGGPARPLVDLLPGEVDFHGLASFGPGALLATVHQLEAEQYGNATVLAGDRRIPLFDLPGESVWGPVVAPESGWLVFERMGHNAARGLWAVPIELEPPRASGSPVLLAPAGATPSLTGDTLVYAPTPDVHTNQLVWVNRTGAVVENVGVPRPGLYPAPALSPDGRTAAVTVAQRLGSNLWTVDLASGAFQQTSFDAGSTLSAPAWTPDGEQLYYYVSTATDDQRILRKRADGSTLVDEVTGGSLEAAISPDGRTLAFSRALPGFRMDLWLRDLETGAETELSATPDWDRHPDFSPDGRLVAFVASGAVVVAEVPPGTGRWQIAPSGNAPRFGAGGRRLYYLAGETMMEVAIEPGPPLRAAQPVPLFERSHAPAEWLAPTFDVDAEGERFLMVVPAGRPPGLVVVRHWQRALGR